MVLGGFGVILRWFWSDFEVVLNGFGGFGWWLVGEWQGISPKNGKQNLLQIYL